MNIYIEASGCSNACRHCAAQGRQPVGNFYSKEEMVRLSAEWGPLTVYHEPTAHPEFPSTYDPALAVDFGGWLVTNGYGIAQREDHQKLLEQMHATGIHTICFSFHGLQKTHDWFAVCPGAFDTLLSASRRARAAGFKIYWQMYLNRAGMDDVRAWSDLAGKEADFEPEFSVPFHVVRKRLRLFEQYRPSVEDFRSRNLDGLLKTPLAGLTAQSWLESWKTSPQADDFKHPFEPRAWPPDINDTNLTLYFLRDRKVYLDARCAPFTFLGELNLGKSIILKKICNLDEPLYRQIDPECVVLTEEEKDRIHPSGYSVRYLAISKARNA